MNTQLDNEIEEQISQCIGLLNEVLGKDLLGVYLYGSAIVGGLQKYSDIDLFVISNRSTTYEEKAGIATRMLKVSGVYMNSTKRTIEMTIVVKPDVNPWHYPPNFDFQYGDWLREKFESGNIEPWETKEMPDLALLITQVLAAHKTLYGLEPDQLLATVPYDDFITAATEEIDSLIADLDCDTRNVLLTLARIWSTVATDTIRSKASAADWVLGRLPQEHQPVLQRARAIAIGEEEEYWEDLKDTIKPCAEFMISRIKEQVSSRDTSDSSDRFIKLAD